MISGHRTRSNLGAQNTKRSWGTEHGAIPGHRTWSDPGAQNTERSWSTYWVSLLRDKSPAITRGEEFKHGSLKFFLVLFPLHLSIRVFQEFHCSLDRLTETWEWAPKQLRVPAELVAAGLLEAQGGPQSCSESLCQLSLMEKPTRRERLDKSHLVHWWF